MLDRESDEATKWTQTEAPTTAVDDSSPPVGKLLNFYRGYLRAIASGEISSELAQKIALCDLVHGTFLEAIPPTIGRFEIRGQLGLGGFGIVYRAFDPLTRREVALKIPRPEILASMPILERFELEAAAAGQLDHPNIVAVLEAGSEGPMPYLVMPYYSGPTLAAWLDKLEKPPELHWSADVVRQLALALEYAHCRGILHRDIKPSNVILSALDPQDQEHSKSACVAKLMDFGLAKVADLAQDLTHTGAIIGTVKYMAPEQATGRKGQVTTASDIYSLGVVLYQLLAGRVPFEGPTEVDTLRQIASDDPPMIPSSKSSKEKDIAAICMKCLEKDLRRRYSTAAALADDLSRYLKGLPVLAQPITRSEKVVKWLRRNPQLASFFALSALALSAFLVFLVYSNSRLSQAIQVAHQNEERAKQNEIDAISRAYSFDIRQAKEHWANSEFESAKELLDRYLPREGYPDLREFAWWWLHRQLSQSSTVLGSHESSVNAVAASPLGGMVASAGSEGKIRLWDFQSRTMLVELDPHRGKEINALAFSPDGSLLASAADDGRVCLFQMPQGTLIKSERHGSGWVATIAFSPDGQQLASAGSDRKISLWSVPDFTVTTRLAGHKDVIRSIVYNDHGQLYSTSEDGEVIAWDLKTHQPDERLPEGRLPRSVAGNHIVYALTIVENVLWGATWELGLESWSLNEENYAKVLHPASGTEELRCIAKDRELFATGTAHGAAVFNRTETSGEHFRLSKHPLGGDRVNSLAFLPNSNQIVIGSRDGKIRLIPRPLLLTPEDSLYLSDDIAGEVDWSGELAHLRWKGDSFLVNPETGEMVLRFPRADKGKFRLATSGNRFAEIENTVDGHYLFVGVLDELARGWRKKLASGTTPTTSIDASHKRVATASLKNLMIFNLDSGEIAIQCPEPAPIASVAFIGDGQRIATLGDDGYVRLRDSTTGVLIEEVKLHDRAPDILQITADATRAVTADDRSICVWKVEGWQRISTIPRRDFIHDVALIGGGETLAVNFKQGLTLWRVADGAELVDFRDIRSVKAMAASPDGQRLLILGMYSFEILDGSPVKE